MWIVKANFARNAVMHYGPYKTELMAQLIVAYLLRDPACISAVYHHLDEL